MPEKTIDSKNAAQRLVAELRKHTNKPQAPLLWEEAADAIETLEKRLRCFAMIYLKLKHPEARTFRIDNQKGGHWTVSTGPFASAFDIIYGSRGLTTDDASEIEEAAAQAVRKAVIEELIERELPPHVTQAGIDAACDSESGEDIQPTDRAFRAMLRSIANEGKDNG